MSSLLNLKLNWTTTWSQVCLALENLGLRVFMIGLWFLQRCVRSTEFRVEFENYKHRKLNELGD